MQELDLTAQRLISVWWLCLWRGMLGGLLVGAIAGFIGGVLIALLGHAELGREGGQIAAFIVTPLQPRPSLTITLDFVSP